jgi:hypothetical protein
MLKRAHRTGKEPKTKAGLDVRVIQSQVQNPDKSTLLKIVYPAGLKAKSAEAGGDKIMMNDNFKSLFSSKEKWLL